MIGIHDIRIFNFAIIDVLGTILIAYIAYRYKIIQSFPISLGLFLLLAIVIHYLLNIPTTLNHILGLSGKSERSIDNWIGIYKK